MIQALRKAIQRMPCPLEVMPTCVCWYAAYPLSLRHTQDAMTERGVGVDHTAAHRLGPRNPAGVRFGVPPVQTADGCQISRNETDIKLAGQWKYLYRAVDRDGDTIDFLLRAKRDCAAARRFLERAIDLHGMPEKITIDKSGANTAAIKSNMIRKGQLNFPEGQASSSASQFYSLAF